MLIEEGANNNFGSSCAENMLMKRGCANGVVFQLLAAEVETTRHTAFDTQPAGTNEHALSQQP
jgi:hypothetical protein